ncbi:MAG: hypothetical protein LAQ30_25950 [Acidobacteriia bacterium]|nr:hypothetical protein [Terriglobia bacterium]
MALLGRDFASLPGNALGKLTPGFVLFNILIDVALRGHPAALRPRRKSCNHRRIRAVVRSQLEKCHGLLFRPFSPRTVILLMLGALPDLILPYRRR